MAQISKTALNAARLLAGRVPPEIAKMLSADEFNDRLVRASELMAQARGTNDVAVRKSLEEMVRATLGAQPRAETERAVRSLIAKAAAMGPRNPEADRLRRQAQDLLTRHPPAPRRAATVTKAKAAEEPKPIPVFDQSGKLLGIVDPADLQPVAVTAGGQPDSTAPVAKAGSVVVWDQRRRPYRAARAAIRTTDRPAVAKTAAKGAGRLAGADSDADLVRKAISSLGPAKYLPVHDWQGKPVGIVKKQHVTALPPGQVLKAAAAADRANVYDASRRRVGTARVSDIVSLANLQAGRRGAR